MFRHGLGDRHSRTWLRRTEDRANWQRQPSDPGSFTAAGSGDEDGGAGEIQQCYTAVARRLLTEPGNHGL